MNQTAVSAEPDIDDDSIDLRRYVLVLLRYWWLVVGLGVVGALVVFLLGLRTPTAYEATSTVLVNKPTDTLSAKALASLASSDEVLAKVASSAREPAAPDPATSASLRGSLTAAVGSDPSLVLLKARASDAAQTADLANAWARALVERARIVYGSSQDVTNAEARLTAADARLAKAESDLAAQQEKSELGTLKAQLTAVQQDQLISLSEKARGDRLLDEIGVLRDQVSRYPADAKVTMVGDLMVTLLEARALGIESPLLLTYAAETGIPLRTTSGTTDAAAETAITTSTTAPISLSAGGTDAASAWKSGDLLELLDDLSAVLKGKANAADARVKETTARLLELQGQVQRAQAQVDRVVLERDIAVTSYQAAASKVDEARAAYGDEIGQISVVSQAAAPSAPMAQNTSRNIAMAAILGVMAGAVLAFVVDWWRQGGRTAKTGSRDDSISASA